MYVSLGIVRGVSLGFVKEVSLGFFQENTGSNKKNAHPEQHFAASLFSMRMDFLVIFLAGRL